MSVINSIFKALGYQPVNKGSLDNVTKTKETLVVKENVIKKTTVPAGRVSKSDGGEEDAFSIAGSYTRPEYNLSIIPKLRSISKTNENVGSVYNDLIQLTNTGHRIKFRQSIPAELADKMKKHLETVNARWGSGVHGIDGLINKWVGQIWVSGSISTEWVPKRDLTGIQNVVLLNPENVVFKYDSNTTFYHPYQLAKNIISKEGSSLIKLNTNTFFYAGILGDTDSPYGIPPFMTALSALATQKGMRKNINHILRQLGLLGYLEVKLDKPTQNAGESDTAYEQRLNTLLDTSKKNVTDGFAEGVVVGYEGDHEFEFHATTKQLNGVSELYNQNEVSMANGLKISPSFLGQKSGGTETNMGIVFTKMLSQLKNVQNILAANLKFGYLLELKLAGYDVSHTDFEIVFSNSTITDDLKLWQTKEIKQRVTKALLIDGIISPDTYAEENGYAAVFGDPIIPFEEQNAKPSTDPQQKENRKEVKKKSDKKGREKKKSQPRRKDQKS